MNILNKLSFSMLLATIGLVGCGGGSSSPAATNNAGGGATSCVATGLNGTTFTAVNGSFGSLAVTGTGSTAANVTALSAQSLSFFNDPLAKIYTWANVPAVSGVMPTTNVSWLTVALTPSTNTLNNITFETFSASSSPLAVWSGTAASGVTGLAVDTANRTATFTNMTVPGGLFGASSTPVTLNGSLCLN